eukprot:2375311-Amphidinium_carterae.1
MRIVALLFFVASSLIVDEPVPQVVVEGANTGPNERAQQRTVEFACQVPALWPSIRCKLNSSDHKVRDKRELLRRWRLKICTVIGSQVNIFRNRDVEDFSVYCCFAFMALAVTWPAVWLASLVASVAVGLQ